MLNIKFFFEKVECFQFDKNKKNGLPNEFDSPAS